MAAIALTLAVDAGSVLLAPTGVNPPANDLRHRAQAKPALSSEQLVEGLQDVTVWFNKETDRLIGLDLEVQRAASGPIDASPYVMRSRGYREVELFADLDGAAFTTVNLDDVSAGRVPKSS
ncbi:hypothetical protein [Glycomyces tritici]|uniref:Uncharacterized protein n=1 Tax=Glycomyces tritici TaxID=2665176 RepID=A0ABT7YM26_9ACTN|nr:hypothetical protein [Glycomyces tritici]MDN3239695.1 hypothetical protein [Glycomyces tritici]